MSERGLTPEQTARARELIAELGALLDAAGAQPMTSRRKRLTPRPSGSVSPEATAKVSRRLRRIGVEVR